MSKRASPELWLKLKPLAREKRRASTRTEDTLWSALRDRKLLGLKFRRQHTIERFIVDFYCAERRLVIEVDGPIHERTPEEDRIRQECLESLALQALRFTNDEVQTNISDVLAKISEETLSPLAESPSLHVVERGLGGEVSPVAAELSLAASRSDATPPPVERGPEGEVHTPPATHGAPR